MGRNQWNWQYENNRKNQGFLKINKTYSKTEKKKRKATNYQYQKWNRKYKYKL